jgi:predicted nuclease of predicted toxin-antitoxin system
MYLTRRSSNAKSNHLVLVTRDFDFADIRSYPPLLYQRIVVLNTTQKSDSRTRPVAPISIRP